MNLKINVYFANHKRKFCFANHKRKFFKISAERLSKLKCRYINYHPSLLIAPVKEEIVFDNPTIWVYHDVVTDKQIETFKKLGGPKVNQSYNCKNKINFKLNKI